MSRVLTHGQYEELRGYEDGRDAWLRLDAAIVDFE